MAKQRVDIEVRALDAASGVFAKIGDSLHRLKTQTGARGPIKDVFELLRGGGAVAGITFGANVLKDMATDMAKVRDEFNEGKIGAGEMVERLAQALPVLGRIRQAGLAIRELFTGEAAAIRQITEEAERTNRIIDLRTAAIKQQQKQYDDNLKTLRDIRLEIEMIGAAPLQKEFATSQQKQTVGVEATTKTFDQQITAAREASKKTLDELEKQTEAARAKIPEGPSLYQRAFGSDQEIEDRKKQISDAQATVADLLKKEADERERAAKQIADLERQKQETLSALAERGFAERQQIIKEESEKRMKEADDQHKRWMEDRARKQKEETDRVLELRRQEAIRQGQEQEEFEKQWRDRMDELNKSSLFGGALDLSAPTSTGRAFTQSSSFASVIASRAIAGTSPAEDAQIQIARDTAKQTDLLRRSFDTLAKASRDVTDIRNELIRQRTEGLREPVGVV